jgi:uncharacterized SAM-binding protein YcdF (DUF218 family)
VINLFTLLLVLLLLAANHGQLSFVLLGVWLIAFLLVGCGPIPHLLMKNLQVGLSLPLPSNTSGRVVIALLGDGTVRDSVSGALWPATFAHSRIAAAARLYRETRLRGNECTIVVTGDDSIGNQSPPVYLTNLVSLGVEKSDVQFDERGTNTYAQARAIFEILRTQHFDRLLLVTSGLHMKRAALYFRNVGLQPHEAPSDFVSVQFTILPNSYNFAMMDIASHQYIGILRMRVYNKLGWNQ